MEGKPSGLNARLVTTGHVQDYLDRHERPAGMDVEVAELAVLRRFFHWHLAFPEVFDASRGEPNPLTGWPGGFDVVLTNPPWGKVKVELVDWLKAHGLDAQVGAKASATKAAVKRWLRNALFGEEARYGAQPPAATGSTAEVAAGAAAAGYPKGRPEKAMARELVADLFVAERYANYLRHCGRFPHASKGDVDLAAIFEEHVWALGRAGAHAGFLVPTTLLTGKTYAPMVKHLLEGADGAACERCPGGRVPGWALEHLYDFVNWQGLFPAVHRQYRFCVVALRRGAAPAELYTAFMLASVEEAAIPERCAQFEPGDIARINPNTRTFPLPRTRTDATLLKRAHERWPVLVDRARVKPGDVWLGPWQLRFATMFHMTNDSKLFHPFKDYRWACEGRSGTGTDWLVLEPATEDGARGKAPAKALPLYEGKLFHQFQHRYAEYALGKGDGWRTHERKVEATAQRVGVSALNDPRWRVAFRWCVSTAHVEEWWDKRGIEVPGYLVTWRTVAMADNRRTLIATIVPPVAIGNSANFSVCGQCSIPFSLVTPVLDSIVVDFCLRRRTSTPNVNLFVVEQLPVPPPEAFEAACPWPSVRGETLLDFVAPRVLELVYTAYDLEPFARDMGYGGDPFAFDPVRRLELRCQLDALFFEMYGFDADDAAYVMKTCFGWNGQETDPRDVHGEEGFRAAVERADNFWDIDLAAPRILAILREGDVWKGAFDDRPVVRLGRRGVRTGVRR